MDVVQVLRKMAEDIETDGVREWNLEPVENSLQPTVDLRGRILSIPVGCECKPYFIISGANDIGAYDMGLSYYGYAYESIEAGNAFITEEAAEQEVIRRKYIQRLRGMEGYKEYQATLSDEALWLDCGIIAYFDTPAQALSAEKHLSTEEIVAFEYVYKGE